MTYKSTIIIDKTVELPYFLHISQSRLVVYRMDLRIKDPCNTLSNDVTTKLNIRLVENAFRRSGIQTMPSKCFKYQFKVLQVFLIRIGVHQNVVQIDQHKLVNIRP